MSMAGYISHKGTHITPIGSGYDNPKLNAQKFTSAKTDNAMCIPSSGTKSSTSSLNKVHNSRFGAGSINHDTWLANQI